ncbi:ArsR family transcriptional regulator [Streptomyces sp. NPDC091292]|uniref:ArsR/SmtB family transcription factor n=1 Tax=Streptomyces sp. NPDC091292 TaxID=3365991 RepID=UPI003805BBBF
MAQEPGVVELSDLAALKALAQPRRQLMLQHLTVHGPATSATLGRALGLNTGATSYHLRELARYGFVAEAEGAGHGRERWWRAVPGDRRFPPRSRQSPEMRLVMEELDHLAYAADLELFAQLRREADAEAEADPPGNPGRPESPDGPNGPAGPHSSPGPDSPGASGSAATSGVTDPAWADAFPYSRGTIRLTVDELHEFFEAYIALLNRYKRPEAETPAAARTVLTRFLAFPAPQDRSESHES